MIIYFENVCINDLIWWSSRVTFVPLRIAFWLRVRYNKLLLNTYLYHSSFCKYHYQLIWIKLPIFHLIVLFLCLLFTVVSTSWTGSGERTSANFFFTIIANFTKTLNGYSIGNDLPIESLFLQETSIQPCPLLTSTSFWTSSETCFQINSFAR